MSQELDKVDLLNPTAENKDKVKLMIAYMLYASDGLRLGDSNQTLPSILDKEDAGLLHLSETPWYQPVKEEFHTVLTKAFAQEFLKRDPSSKQWIERLIEEHPELSPDGFTEIQRESSQSKNSKTRKKRG